MLAFSFACLPTSFQIMAAAQGGLLTHKDIANEFSVSYPSEWIKQDNVYDTHGVQFSPQSYN